MFCPACKHDTTEVKDSRLSGSDGLSIRRRRVCASCGHRFTTFEVPRAADPHLMVQVRNFLQFMEKARQQEMEILASLIGRLTLEIEDKRLVSKELITPEALGPGLEGGNNA